MTIAIIYFIIIIAAISFVRSVIKIFKTNVRIDNMNSTFYDVSASKQGVKATQNVQSKYEKTMEEIINTNGNPIKEKGRGRKTI